VFGSYAGYAHVMDGTTNGYITFYAAFIFVIQVVINLLSKATAFMDAK